jgi:hypothetical protein
MFITKRRHNLEVKRLNDELFALELEAKTANRAELNAVAAKRKLQMQYSGLVETINNILASRTAASNGTTKRIMRELTDALNELENNERAEFVTDAPQPTGTLADLKRFIGNSTKLSSINVSYRDDNKK